jgi:uncharacterized protein (TIGR02145 family)
MKKKMKFELFQLFIMGILIFVLYSCKKDDNDNNTVTDIDGNVYHTVTIDKQVWMVENLKVTHYRNGDSIRRVTNNSSWSNLSTGAYCDYANSPGNSITYGRLYNWYAVTDPRNLAPEGWHVPSDAEWTVLTNNLGGQLSAGGKLKETGTSHWLSPNAAATNEIGFTALPGGKRYGDGSFDNIGTTAAWWSSTGHNSGMSWGRGIDYNLSSIYWYGTYNETGLSVRCVKN